MGNHDPRRDPSKSEGSNGANQTELSEADQSARAERDRGGDLAKKLEAACALYALGFCLFGISQNGAINIGPATVAITDYLLGIISMGNPIAYFVVSLYYLKARQHVVEAEGWILLTNIEKIRGTSWTLFEERRSFKRMLEEDPSAVHILRAKSIVRLGLGIVSIVLILIALVFGFTQSLRWFNANAIDRGWVLAYGLGAGIIILLMAILFAYVRRNQSKYRERVKTEAKRRLAAMGKPLDDLEDW